MNANSAKILHINFYEPNPARNVEISSIFHIRKINLPDA